MNLAEVVAVVAVAELVSSIEEEEEAAAEVASFSQQLWFHFSQQEGHHSNGAKEVRLQMNLNWEVPRSISLFEVMHFFRVKVARLAVVTMELHCEVPPSPFVSLEIVLLALYFEEAEEEEEPSFLKESGVAQYLR